MEKVFIMTTSQRFQHDVINLFGAFCVGAIMTGAVYESLVWKPAKVVVRTDIHLDCKPAPGEAVIVRQSLEGEIQCAKVLEKPLGVSKLPTQFLQPIWRM